MVGGDAAHALLKLNRKAHRGRIHPILVAWLKGGTGTLIKRAGL